MFHHLKALAYTVRVDKRTPCDEREESVAVSLHRGKGTVVGELHHQVALDNGGVSRFPEARTSL